MNQKHALNEVKSMDFAYCGNLLEHTGTLNEVSLYFSLKFFCQFKRGLTLLSTIEITITCLIDVRIT